MEGLNSILDIIEERITKLKYKCKEITENENHSALKNMCYPESAANWRFLVLEGFIESLNIKNMSLLINRRVMYGTILTDEHWWEMFPFFSL